MVMETMAYLRAEPEVSSEGSVAGHGLGTRLCSGCWAEPLGHPFCDQSLAGIAIIIQAILSWTMGKAN